MKIPILNKSEVNPKFNINNNQLNNNILQNKSLKTHTNG